ncbi:MAG: TRAP transporter large permease subunit, partial [Pseudomonadota bacterium]
MSGIELTAWGFAAMLTMIALRMPIAVAMAITGFVGTWVTLGRVDPILNQLKSVTYDTFSSYSLSLVPLFLLMGQFASKSGMSEKLFRAAADWMGHRKGGIAMAAVGACAGFGAVSGSSLATASTMGQVALPQMKRYGYSDALATGALAAGGTLGILIPPSIILVIYAIQAEQNIEKMFAAAIIPGIVAALGYMLVVALYVRLVPDAANAQPRKPYRDRLKTLGGVWPVVVIFLLVIGGIAGDWNWLREGRQALFTPIEGAAVGAAATGLYGLLTGGLTLRSFRDCVLETAVATAMIYFILFGAQLFNTFLAFTQTPQHQHGRVSLGRDPCRKVLGRLRERKECV